MFESRPLRAMQSKEGAARKCGVFVFVGARCKLAYIMVSADTKTWDLGPAFFLIAHGQPEKRPPQAG